MKSIVLASALTAACSSARPAAEASVALPVILPVPSAAETVATPRVVKPLLDAADFTSERGAVHLTVEADGMVDGSFESDGVVTCSAPRGDALACEWVEGSADGHATLHRKTDGRLEGTWGNGASDADGGVWTLVPVARGDSGMSGAWMSNWGAATVEDTGHGVHAAYTSGVLDCTRRDARTLACTWVEGSSTGAAVLVIESPRVLRGTWGNGASATDGGKWLFVRR